MTPKQNHRLNKIRNHVRKALHELQVLDLEKGSADYFLAKNAETKLKNSELYIETLLLEPKDVCQAV